MSKIQGNIPASDGEPNRFQPVQDDPSAPEMMAAGGPGMEDGAGPCESTLLSQPAAPQYRRSLFRR